MLGKLLDKFCFNTLFLVGFVLVLGMMQLSSVLKKGEGEKMTETKPVLPLAIGEWTRSDSPKTVTAENIFDYMNGAGELYLGYRFDRCDVYEYRAESQKEILVELYQMKTSDDAFGLLSLDWGGTAVDLDPGSLKADRTDAIWPRALYGEGLLRLRSGRIYARVMATQETPESREAVLSLGRAVLQGRESFSHPKLLETLPEVLSTGWELRRDRASYFRTHLVLNSLYYLSHQNILDLDLACEAVATLYEKEDSAQKRTRIQFLLVKYPDGKRAREGLARFSAAYLPEHPFVSGPGDSWEAMDTVSLEDGWMAYKLQGKRIFFVFECPDRKTARTLMEEFN